MSALAQQILSALEAASSAEQHTRHAGEVQLAQLRSDAVAYFTACAEVLVTPAARLHGRQLVGYQLKNNLSHPACAGNAALQAAVCTHAVVDAQKSIRAVACSIISAAVRDNLWPVEAVVPQLTSLLAQRGGDVAAVHGAVRALSQIVDDCVYVLDTRQMTRAIVQAVLPFVTSAHLTTTAASTVLEVRSTALEILVAVLEQANADYDAYTYRSMQDAVLTIIDACFSTLRSPPSNAIAAKCIRCLVLCLAFHTQISDTLFGTMVQLMYQATTSPHDTSGTDEQLHMEATLFWSAVLQFPRFAAIAEAAMVSVIPTLIRAMVYSDMEMSMLQASAEDWQVPDKLDAIRPRHYQARQQQQQQQQQQQVSSSSSANNNKSGANAEDGDDDENDNNDNDDDDDDEEVETWNLRRVSARTLDAMSEHYGERILTPVLHELDAMMQPAQPWRELEAAVLALGAICDGCFDALAPHLPAISTRLLELLASPQTHFLVVNICLWTLTQIGRYLVDTPALLQRFVRLVLGKMQSPSKLVQEGATSALDRITVLCDDGQLSSSTALAGEVVTCIAQCLRGYQLKNRVLLFEVLETVCAHVSDVLRGDAALVQTLLSPLGELWASTANDSPLLFALFRCMSSVCTALGPAVQPMAPEMFDRAYGLLQLHMQQRVAIAQQQQQQPSGSATTVADAMDELAEPEFVITSADLLSGLFDALGSGVEPLLGRHQPAFMHVVLAMLRDAGSVDIRQSGFSLVGDVAKTCPRYVQEVLPAYCDAALANVAAVDEHNYGVVSNVAWSLCSVLEHQHDVSGLPTLHGDGACSAAAAQLFARLASVLGRGELCADMRNMAENVALCLGMMLYVDADVQTRARCGADVFARRFGEYVRNIRDMPQRELALGGFVHALQQRCGSPDATAATAALQVVVSHLTVFFDLACSIAADSADTQRAMRQLLEQAKGAAPQVWQQRLGAYNAQLRAKLYHMYGLS